MSPSSKHPHMGPDVLEFGRDFTSSPYKLEIGMWVVHQAIGEAFSAAEVARDMESMRHLADPIPTARLYIHPFVKLNMVQVEDPTGRFLTVHQWSRLDSPWWRVFRAVNIAAQEINQRGEWKTTEGPELSPQI